MFAATELSIKINLEVVKRLWKLREFLFSLFHNFFIYFVINLATSHQQFSYATKLQREILLRIEFRT